MNREVLAYLSMGSNMGNKLAYLIEGLIEIDALEGVEVSKVSPFYETPPWGYLSQDSFYNIAVEVKTTLLPYKLLRALQEIELKLHRKREVRWGPRTLDIDIIFYDNLEFRSDDLNIPHIHYRERKFVLKPLYDVYSHKQELLKYIYGKEDEITKVVPSVVVSSCLLGEECTYRGDSNYRKLLDKLELNYERVCPEVMGGLAIPRTPAERIGNRVVDKSGRDVTLEFNRGAEETLKIAMESKCELAILKAKSPSCGKGAIYNGEFTGTLIEGNGVTTDLLESNGIDVIVI